MGLLLESALVSAVMPHGCQLAWVISGTLLRNAPEDATVFCPAPCHLPQFPCLRSKPSEGVDLGWGGLWVGVSSTTMMAVATRTTLMHK